jgi:hypothetical protein
MCALLGLVANARRSPDFPLLDSGGWRGDRPRVSPFRRNREVCSSIRSLTVAVRGMDNAKTARESTLPHLAAGAACWEQRGQVGNLGVGDSPRVSPFRRNREVCSSIRSLTVAVRGWTMQRRQAKVPAPPGCWEQESRSGTCPTYWTFHSSRPADQPGCMVTSRRKAVVVTGWKVSLLYLSFSTP